MNITADTNLLVRAAVDDDPAQGERARQALRTASTVAIGTACLCEFVCVLARGYGISKDEIAAAILRLVRSHNVSVDRLAVDAGLGFLRAGAEFADGVIAFEGRRLGADVFVSFDRRAVNAAHQAGYTAALPASPEP